MKISDIKISTNRRRVDAEKVQELAKSIKELGLLNPVVVTSGGVLVAGAHRLEAFKVLGRDDIPVTVIEVNALQAELAEIDENFVRNDLTVAERVIQMSRRKEVYESLYPETKHGANQHTKRGVENFSTPLPDLIPQDFEPILVAPERFTENTAKIVGKTSRSVEMDVKLGNALRAAPEVVEAIRDTPVENNASDIERILAIEEPETRKAVLEKVSQGQKAKQAIREVEREAVVAHLESVEVQKAKAVEGVYDVIVIDPPWPMEKIERDVTPNQVAFEYPTMSLDEIADMPIPAADDCHVFLWTTQKFLPASLDLLKQWGFKYVLTFVWHKNGGFQPFGLPQYNCEFAVYARKGTPKFVDFKDFPTCFSANRKAHSEKPEEFYSLLRRVTAGRRLDMFNRRKIDGFDGWGKEAA